MVDSPSEMSKAFPTGLGQSPPVHELAPRLLRNDCKFLLLLLLLLLTTTTRMKQRVLIPSKINSEFSETTMNTESLCFRRNFTPAV